MGLRYEYQYVTSTPGTHGPTAFSELLNVMGSAGWEAMDAPEYIGTIGGGHWRVWMERVTEEDPPKVRTPEETYNELVQFYGIEGAHE